MDVVIHKVHAQLTDEQEALIRKKISRKLQRFRDHILSVDVFIKTTQAHSNNFSSEIEFKVNVPGNTIVVSETAHTFESAIDKALDALRQQLVRYKERKRPFR